METTVATLEQRIAATADPVAKAEALDELSRAIWPRDLARALALAEQAHDLARSTGDPAVLARALETFGYLLWHSSDYPRATSILLEALNIARTIHDRAREASTLHRLAVINHDLGSYPDSLTYFYQALALARELGDTVRQACALNDIGYVCSLLRQPEEALPYLQESLAISQHWGYEQVEAAVLDSLGQTYYQLGDYEHSLLYAQQGQTLAQRAGLSRSETEVSITLGKTYAALGQLEQALQYLSTALDLSRANGLRNFEISALVELGKVHGHQGDPALALTRLDAALAAAEQIGKKQSIYEIHQGLADIHAQAGDFPRALEHYRQFHALKEEVFNNQADHRIKSLQVTYQVEQTRQQSEIYQLKNVELQRQIEEKERLIADLDAFASMVAHDLKNPLSVITANAELIALDEETALSGDSEEYLTDLLHVGYKMNRVIDDLLILAGVRRDDLTLQPVHMAGIVADVHKRLIRLIRHYNAAITVPEAWPVALGHAGLIEEVWANYISNAIKYGGQPPVIELGASPQPDGMIGYWVRDNGSGIPPNQQDQLFTEYTRLNRSHSADGTGLGLVIVKRIMDRLGGTYRVSSTGLPGEGSTFMFTLPAAE